jgi:hypothetical protein
MSDPENKKSAKSQILALHKNSKAGLYARARAMRSARRNQGEPPSDEDSQVQAMVRENCEWVDSVGLWEPKFTSYSDYSGSYVERSNAAYWMANYTIFDQVHGGHGTVWTGLTHDILEHLDQDTYEQLKNDLEGLEQYPVLDEDLMSSMEFQAKQTYWEEEGRSELKRAMLDKLDETGGSPETRLAIIYANNDFWNELASRHDFDQEMTFEEGASIYFRAERAARDLPLEEFEALAEEEPRLIRAQAEALKREWPVVLQSVKKVLGEDYARKFDSLSEEHALNVFKHLEAQDPDNSLWDVSDDVETNPSDNLTINAYNLEAALANVNERTLHAAKPVDPNQMDLPLFSKESMNALDIVSSLLEGFKEKKAAFIAAGADPTEVETALAQFKALKARNMLSPEEVDIDRYANFEDLQAVLQQAAGRTRSPSAPSRKIKVRDDAELVHDDSNATIVVPNTYEASKFYGAGTKWCIAAEAYPTHFANYRRDLAKHYMILFKNRPSSDRDYKVALTVYPNRRMAHDATDAEVPMAEFEKRTGFSPNDPMFTPWDWRKMPPHERWKVAKRDPQMTFAKFVAETDDETWDTIGQRVTALKQQWFQGQKDEAAEKEAPEPSNEELEHNWVGFWREARKEALQDPNDRDYLDTLQYYVDITESRVSSQLADLLLDGQIREGEVKDWIMAVTDPSRVRARLGKRQDLPSEEGDEDIEHHPDHGPLL